MLCLKETERLHFIVDMIFFLCSHTKVRGQFSSWSVSGISPMNILVLENITRAKIKIIIIVIKLSCTSNE